MNNRYFHLFLHAEQLPKKPKRLWQIGHLFFAIQTLSGIGYLSQINCANSLLGGKLFTS